MNETMVTILKVILNITKAIKNTQGTENVINRDNLGEINFMVNGRKFEVIIREKK